MTGPLRTLHCKVRRGIFVYGVAVPQGGQPESQGRQVTRRQRSSRVAAAIATVIVLAVVGATDGTSSRASAGTAAGIARVVGSIPSGSDGPSLAGADDGLPASRADDGSRAIGADDGLRTVDVSIPSAPRPRGRLNHGWYGYDFEIDGDLAFVNCGDGGGMKVVDLTDPSAPLVVATYWPADPGDWLQATVHGLAARDEVAYVVVETSGRAGWVSTQLDVVDVSEADMPALLSSVPLLHESESYAGRFATIHGELLAVTSHDSIVILDASDPQRPTIVGAHRVGYGVLYAVAQGDILYLLTEEGLVVADVSEPDRFEVVGTLPLEVAPDSRSHLAPGRVGDRSVLSVVANGALTVLDVTNPAEPNVIAGREQAIGWEYMSSAIEGYRVHVKSAGGGYEALEIDALQPSWSSAIALPYASVR